MNPLEEKAVQIEKELASLRVMWRHMIGSYSAEALKSIDRMEALAAAIRREAHGVIV